MCVLISSQSGAYGWQKMIPMNVRLNLHQKYLNIQIHLSHSVVCVLILSQSGAYGWQNLVKTISSECPTKYLYQKYLNIQIYLTHSVVCVLISSQSGAYGWQKIIPTNVRMNICIKNI